MRRFAANRFVAKRLVAPDLAAKRFAASGALLLLVALSVACGEPEPVGTRVIVLGFDGMDHALTSRLISEGRLPNLARLAESGSFAPLETSIPPQSPVAWSD
ncbi:MAG: alkaline phosphatase family protein, partial [Gemmatimonadota bacterium]